RRSALSAVRRGRRRAQAHVSLRERTHVARRCVARAHDGARCKAHRDDARRRLSHVSEAGPPGRACSHATRRVTGAVSILRKLEPGDEQAFWRALAATVAREPRFAHYYRPDLAFAEYLRVLDDAERGIVPDGHVPSTLLFGFADGEIVGRLMLRHKL